MATWFVVCVLYVYVVHGQEDTLLSQCPSQAGVLMMVIGLSGVQFGL